MKEITNYMLIRDGIIENIIVADEDFAASLRTQWDFVLKAPPNAQRGWHFIDGVVTMPPSDDQAAQADLFQGS